MTVRNIASICNMVSILLDLCVCVAIDLPAATVRDLACSDAHTHCAGGWLFRARMHSECSGGHY